MKKIMLLFALFLTFIAGAQTNYPYKRPELLFDKVVKVKPLEITMDTEGFEHFYTIDGGTYERLSTGITKPEALNDRVFRVVEVKPYVKFGDPVSDLILEDTTTKEKIKYYYNPLHVTYSRFPFEVAGGLTLPPDFYCDYIIKVITGQEYITQETNQSAFVTKRIDPKTKKVTYQLTIHISTHETSNSTGVEILLENNLKISKPKMVVGLDGQQLYAFIDLGPKDLELLSNNQILDIKLSQTKEGGYFYELGKADRLRGALKCMLSQ